MSGGLLETNGANSPAASTGDGASITMEGIEHPGINDVMFGRGGDTNYHIGNHRFRVLADEHRQGYRSASRKEKQVVVQEVVRCWRDRGGRFLTKTNPEKGDESLWHDVGDSLAKKKAAKILSEKAPEEKSNENRRSDDNRKRPAMESVDADRTVKQPAVARLVATGGQGGAMSSASTAASAGATAASLPSGTSLIPSAATSNIQQPPQAPVQQQLPLNLGYVPMQPALRQMLPIPAAVSAGGSLGGTASIGNLGASSLVGNLGAFSVARDLLGLNSNPLVISALATNGLNPTEIDVTRLALISHVIAQERSAARAKMALANTVLCDLRVAGLLQLLAPGLGGDAAATTAALIGVLRLGLNNGRGNNGQGPANPHEEGPNDDNSSNPNNESRSDPPPG